MTEIRITGETATILILPQSAVPTKTQRKNISISLTKLLLLDIGLYPDQKWFTSQIKPKKAGCFFQKTSTAFC
jgi:hypothetical protein